MEQNKLHQKLSEQKMFYYNCNYCNYSTYNKNELLRHQSCVHNVRVTKSNTFQSFLVNCTKCPYSDKNYKKVMRHHCIEHKQYFECQICKRLSKTYKKHMYHLNSHYPTKDKNLVKFDDTTKIYKRLYIRSLKFLSEEEKSIEFSLYVKYYNQIKQEFEKMLREHKYFKVMFMIHGLFQKLDFEGQIISSCNLVIPSGPLQDFSHFEMANFDSFFISLIQGLLEYAEKVETQGSGLVMKCITQFDIKFGVPSLLGSCINNFDFVEMYSKKYPKFHIAKDHLVDTSNPTNNRCVLSAIATAILLKEDESLINDLAKLKLLSDEYVKIKFKTKGIVFPFSIKSCQKLEKRNKHLHLAFNVWGLNGKSCWPMYTSKANKFYNRVDILLVQPESYDKIDGHYVSIFKTNIFLRVVKQYLINDRKMNIRPLHYCDQCARCFTNEKRFSSHIYFCKNKNQQKISYAEKGDSISFDYASQKQVKSAYIGFADFEAKMSNKSNEENFKNNNCENCRQGGPVRNCDHSERILSDQLPMTFCFCLFSSDGKLIYEKTQSSENNIMKYFFDALLECEEKLETLNPYKELHWTNRLQEKFDKEIVCYMCQTGFVPGDLKYDKVRDHCHATPPIFNKDENKLESVYLGAAHRTCNLKRKSTDQIPIYIHNFMCYDSNFILSHLDLAKSEFGSIGGIPYNKNKLRNLKLGKWNFLDSYQINPGSLSDLVENLAKDKITFSLVEQGLPHYHEVMREMIKKGAYPYEWVESVSQLACCTSFPPYEAFFSHIKGKNISKEFYLEAKKMYKKLNVKNMLEYTELYCKLDVLLLAEVIMKFRANVYDDFQLAIENYISCPQLSFDACLKKTGVKLEQISDETMVSWLEQNIRGGISFVNNRYEKVTDPSKESLLYIDANNLYGWAQKMFLPTGNYKWVQYSNVNKLKWESMNETQNTGYIAEVDLEFPPQIHSKLQDLPLAPYHMDISFDKLSPFSQEIQTKTFGRKISQNYKQKKLVTDLLPKKRYIIHYLNLKLYLSLGAKITNIYNVMSFDQSDFLKPYIEFLSAKRAASKTKFAQNLYKLLSNSLYGKFIQDVRKYSNIKFINNEKDLGRYISNPFFEDCVELSNNICIVFMKNETIKLDRLYSIGFSILELSKHHMFSAWYKFILPVFENNCKLVLTDTDSFVIKFTHDSKESALKKLEKLMDFSNFPENSKFYDSSKKKVPGFFKDEYPMGIIKEAVSVRSKCYFLKIDPDPKYTQDKKGTEHIVCKGISQAVSSKFPIDLYKNCILSQNTIVKSSMFRIKAKKRKLSTVQVTKTVMSSGDDKRYQTCHIHSVPYGYLCKRIKNCPKC